MMNNRINAKAAKFVAKVAKENFFAFLCGSAFASFAFRLGAVESK
jgi:hypothetical protein